jgi:phosphohistidine swiveling domain-containing protein
MATVIPVDEFISDEWYPGFKPGYGHAPWCVDPVRTFCKEDEKAFWFLDFHWQRGHTPMGLTFMEDGYNWSTQLAAEQMPLPPGRGLTCRLGGTHPYGSAIPVDDPREISQRARRLEHTLPRFLRDFEPIWGRMREELSQGWDYFCGVDLSALSLAELRENLIQARRYTKRAAEIHFQVMYPLLANYTGFYGMCTELGLDPGQIGKFLQGYDTKIMETDRELWRLATAARAAGLEPVFAAHEADGIRAALAAHGGSAGAWLTRLDDFLQVYGWRTEGPVDVALPSWIEDPAPVLGMIKTFLEKDTDHDFEAARAAAVEERVTAVDAARSVLTLGEQRLFDDGLASCRAANFPWWQDDHNFYIDLRVMLPMRWACHAIADRVGAGHPDDTLYLFWDEIMDLSGGGRRYDAGLRSLVEQRKQYFDYWLQRRPSLPKVVGTVPDSVSDPILIEIFGLNSHFLQVVAATGSGGPAKVLTGVPASKGVGRGIARVLHDPGGLHRLSPGQVLVCESTSPNWTPAFAKIAACVCDGGGTLSHAAIVGREYGVPTVTGVGLATLLIADGDEVEVDGTSGQVTVLRPAAALPGGVPPGPAGQEGG